MTDRPIDERVGSYRIRWKAPALLQARTEPFVIESLLGLSKGKFRLGRRPGSVQ